MFLVGEVFVGIGNDWYILVILLCKLMRWFLLLVCLRVEIIYLLIFWNLFFFILWVVMVGVLIWILLGLSGFCLLNGIMFLFIVMLYFFNVFLVLVFVMLSGVILISMRWFLVLLLISCKLFEFNFFVRVLVLLMICCVYVLNLVCNVLWK